MLMVVFAAAEISGRISASLALQRFSESSDSRLDAPDFTLWSAQRIRDYKESLAHNASLPLAVLRIPKLKLEVPVFDGTDELTLNRGAGRIVGTSKPGEPGNTGIAGHRDGFFRGLKDVVPGDVLDLVIPGRTERYVVSDIQVTTPDDVSVLRPTATPTLTLVTCYPFYFVGSAPQRYIVRASIRSTDTPADPVASAGIP